MSWFTDLSKKQQEEYIRNHPGSKYAKAHRRIPRSSNLINKGKKRYTNFGEKSIIRAEGRPHTSKSRPTSRVLEKGKIKEPKIFNLRRYVD